LKVVCELWTGLPGEPKELLTKYEAENQEQADEYKSLMIQTCLQSYNPALWEFRFVPQPV
jgi:hypothetical protein